MSARAGGGEAKSQPWLVCCEEAFGNGPQKPIQKNGPAKNRQYGQYLGRKLASAQNLFWIMGGDNDPKGDRECLFAFFEGLRETAPAHQLMTYHASPPHSSTDLFHARVNLGLYPKRRVERLLQVQIAQRGRSPW